jgi:hypothetical protein
MRELRCRPSIFVRAELSVRFEGGGDGGPGIDDSISLELERVGDGGGGAPE